MKNIFFAGTILVALSLSAQTKKYKTKRPVINTKIEAAKLKTQLSQEISSYVYVTQDSFNKNCCSKSDPSVLDAMILQEYQEIQKDIQTCLKIKSPVLKAMTKSDRDFEDYAMQINKEVAKMVNDQRLDAATRKKAYDDIQRSIEAQNKKRQAVYAKSNDRRVCVGADYKRLLNPLTMKLHGDRGGSAYAFLRKCVSPVGDLYFQCTGNSTSVNSAIDSSSKKKSTPLGSQQ